MVVLTVGIQTGRGAEGGIGRGGTGVTESRGSAHQHDGSSRGEADVIAEGDEEDSQNGDRTEGGTDTHGDQKADECDDDRSDQLAAAHDGNASFDQLVDAAGRLDDGRITAGDEHNESDQTHELHATGELLVDLVPGDGAEDDHDGETGEGGQSEVFGEDLSDDDDDDGSHGHIVTVAELAGNSVGRGGISLDHLIVAGLAIEHEHGDQQADEHGDREDPVDLGDIVDGNGHAVGGQVVADDGLEDQTEAEGNGDVGSLMTEGKAAGHSAAVEAHLVHQHEHGRNQDGDVSDVDGDEVLGQAGDQGDHTEKHELLGADDLAQLLGDDVGKAGRRDRRSEGTKQDVSKSGGRVAGEAGREQTHNAVAGRGIDGDAADKTAGNTGDQHGEQNVQLQKAEYAQHDDRYGNGVG